MVKVFEVADCAGIANIANSPDIAEISKVAINADFVKNVEIAGIGNFVGDAEFDDVVETSETV